MAHKQLLLAQAGENAESSAWMDDSAEGPCFINVAHQWAAVVTYQV